MVPLARALRWLLFFILPGCNFLTSPQAKSPVPLVAATPLPYVTLTLSRANGGLLPNFKVTELATSTKATVGTSAYPLDESHIALRRLAPAETVLFTIDFGPGYEIAQMTFSGQTYCGDGTYTLYHENATQIESYICGPSQSSPPIEISGEAGDILVNF